MQYFENYGSNGGNYMISKLLTISAFALAASPVSAAGLFGEVGFGSDPTVTFDSPTLPAGTPVTNQFAAQGVTFSASPGALFASGNPGAYSSISGFQGSYLDTFSGGSGGSGVYNISFSNAVTRAGAYYELNQDTSATFAAFNGNVLIESFSYYNPSCCNSGQFIGFADITFDRIQISGVTGDAMIMDTLRFTPGGATGAIPEPSTWAMLIVGFGAVGAGMRLSRRRQVEQAAA